MIETTKNVVESTYKNVRVVYGDTDSVMIETEDDETQTDTERLQCGSPDAWKFRGQPRQLATVTS